MSGVTGIRFEQDASGITRYARIDLRRYGNNELLEDFFDSLEMDARENDETVPWEEVRTELDKKFNR